MSVERVIRRKIGVTLCSTVAQKTVNLRALIKIRYHVSKTFRTKRPNVDIDTLRLSRLRNSCVPGKKEYYTSFFIFWETM